MSDEISVKRPRGRPRKYNRVIPNHKYYYSDAELKKRLAIAEPGSDTYKALVRALDERKANSQELNDALSADVIAPVSDRTGEV